MRSQLGIRFLAVAFAIAACLSVTSVHAGFLAQLEGLQLQKGAIHQFRFEGNSGALRQYDHGSQHSHLQVATGEGGMGINEQGDMDPLNDVPYSYPAGDPNAIGYNPGFDGAGVSQAYRPQSVLVGAAANDADEILAQRRSGAGLYIPTFTTPAMMTVEAVVQPDAYPENLGAGGSLHYVLQIRNGGGTNGRGYFLAQQSPDGSRGVAGSLVSAIGHPFSSHAARARVAADYSDQDHWYYVAVTFDMSNTSAPAVINAWAADLTAGGPLVQTVTNYTDPATTVSGNLVGVTGSAGLGLFYRGNNLGQEFFNGAIDNLAVYASKLSAADIAQHYRALTVQGVPEPASIVLLALAGVAIAGLRRRFA